MASNHHARLDSAKWKAVCVQVKDRDGHSCTECGAEEDLTVDHIVALDNFTSGMWEAEQQYDPDWLTTLCRRCNGRKSNRVVVRQNWVNRRWLDHL